MRKSIVRARRLRCAATVTVIAFAAVACGGDDDSADQAEVTDSEQPSGQEPASGDASGSETPSGETSSASDQATEAESGPGEETTVRISWGAPPEGWVPGAGTFHAYMLTAYETLIVPDVSTEELTDVAPGLASSWEQTDEAITFTLQEGVVFQDGEPMNAEAVKASLEFARDEPGQFQGFLAPIESIDAVDEFTVRLNLSQPTPSLLNELTGQAGIIARPVALADGTLNTRPVGTGPWIYDEEASIADQTWSFKAWDGYWGEIPADAPTRIEYVATPDDSARLSALLAGEIDVADLTPTFAEDARDEGMEVFEYPAVGGSLIMFDRGPGGVFEDVDVRRALCQAIDTDSIVAASDNFIAAKDQRFVDPTWRIDYEATGYDPEAAAAFVASLPEAPAATLPSIAGGSPLGEAVAGMLEAAGFQIEVRAIPEAEYHPTWNSGEYPMGIGGESELHPYSWYAGFFSADGPYNPAGVESPELAAAASAAIAAGTSDEAIPLWHDALAIMYDETIMCPYFDINQFLVSNPDTVANVLPVPFQPAAIQLRTLQVP